MMKVNDKYEITSDKYQWILNEIVDVKDKDGNPKKKKVPSYHASLQQVCSAIINREAKGVDNIDELIVQLKHAEDTLVQKLVEAQSDK